MTPYQFSLIRYVHDVSTGEFANIGIVMWIPSQNKFAYRLTEHHARLSNFYANFVGSDYRYLLRTLKSRLEQARKNQFFGQKINNIGEILPQIIPLESGCFQWSETMGGVVPNPEERLNKLFANIVLLHEQHKVRPRRSEKDIIDNVYKHLKATNLLSKMKTDVEVLNLNSNFSYKFAYGWQNGTSQYAEAISLDYKNKKDIENKTSGFIGDMFSLKDAEDFQVTGIVAPPQNPELTDDFKRAVDRLYEAPRIKTIVSENEINKFIPQIERDIQDHK